jgi:replicative DNA helicase
MRIEAEGLVARKSASARLRYQLLLPEEPTLDSRACVVCGAQFMPQTSQVRTCGRSCGGRARFTSPPVPAPRCARCGGASCGLRLCQSCRNAVGTLQARLRTIGVLGSKHIPVDYLRASEAQRRALLAGLLDTDGTVTAGGSVQFSVTSHVLADDFSELVASLGYRCQTSTKRVKGRSEATSTAYTITFATEDEVFGLHRKALLHKERRAAANTARSGSRFIVDVRAVESVPVRCVEVDNVDHMYLASRAMVPTHNSTLGLDFMRSCSIKNRLPSVIFSLEMSKSEIVMRLLSAEAKIKLADMRSGRMSDDDWTKLARRMSEISEAPLYIDDSPNLTMMEIRAKARRLSQKAGLRLIVVDYLQLMSSGKKYDSRQQEVSDFSRALKLMAKELDAPVVAISQLNRGPEQRTDKKPMVSDLRESGSLEQDADMVILLHRPDAFERDDPRGGEADLILGKHRNGPTKTITVAHQLHLSRFTNMAH